MSEKQRFQGRIRRPDVLVIGGGLAGMTAALAARQTGASVAMVAEGAGVLELSSGCIDRLASPFAALRPDHPYRLLGQEAVDWELATFQLELEQVGWQMTPPPNGANQEVVTALGGRRPTYLVSPGMAAPQAGLPHWVVGFRALRDFHPGVVASGLGHGSTWSWIELPGSPAEIHPVALARHLEEPAYREEVLKRIAKAFPTGEEPASVLVPSVLGLTRAATVQSAFAKALGRPIAEVLLPPPSVPGLRLAEFLRRAVQQVGIDLSIGARVVGSEVEGGLEIGSQVAGLGEAGSQGEHGREAGSQGAGRQVVSVRALGPGGETIYQAKSFVLATGGILGNGLVSKGLQVREPIFGLPVTTPAGSEPSDWADASFLAAAGHPFVRLGVSVDAALRPCGFQNLYACGRTLAGYDPYAEGSGGGVAVATGGVAGRLAGRQALGHVVGRGGMVAFGGGGLEAAVGGGAR